MSEESKFKYEFGYGMSHLTYRRPIVPDAYDCIARGIIPKEDCVHILVEEFRRDVTKWLEEEVWK